jgi:hypothetical protein
MGQATEPGQFFPALAAEADFGSGPVDSDWPAC